MCQVMPKGLWLQLPEQVVVGGRGIDAGEVSKHAWVGVNRKVAHMLETI